MKCLPFALASDQSSSYSLGNDGFQVAVKPMPPAIAVAADKVQDADWAVSHFETR
jgi:hypothetical protein